MRKNISGQKVGVQMVSATDGSAFTGSVTVAVTGDAGTQATGSVGSGACTHEGNGYHTYAPAQAETNYDLVAFTFTGSGAIPATVQVYTLPTTGILAPATAGRTLVVDAAGLADANVVKLGPSGSGTAQTARDIGASVLLSSGTGTGQLDFTSGVVKANATQFAGQAITCSGGVTVPAATLASTTNITAGTITTTTNLTNLPGIPNNWITAAGINADAFTAAKFASDVTTEFQSGLATASALTTVEGKVDSILDDTGTSGVVVAAGSKAGYSLSTAGLAAFFIADSGEAFADAVAGSVVKEIADNAGGASLTVQDIVDGVWDEPQASHASAGTFGILASEIADILADTAEIGAAGAGLTNINLPDQTMNITGNLSGSVGSVTGGINTAAGVITTLDALDTAQDAQHSTTQTAIADLPTNSELATALAAADDAVLAAISALNNLSAAEVNAEVDTALADIHLDHLLAATYDPASKPGAADALLNELVESDSGVSRFTANALEQAPTGGSAPSAADIRAEIDANSTQLAAIVADTSELQADWANGGRLDAILDARASQASVDDLPTNAELATALAAADDAVLAAIAALNDLSAAQVNAEVDAALADYDGPTKAELDSAVAPLALASTLGTPADADLATDIANAAAQISGLNDISPAEVNAEVVDALSVDGYAEPTGVPAATASLATKVGYLAMALRNKITVTATDKTFHDDAGNAEWRKALSDDGTAYQEEEASSP